MGWPMLSSTHCSNSPAADHLHAVDEGGRECAQPSRPTTVLALEGMPGAGKTTLATTLSRRGHLVVPEYATVDGSVIALEEHPDVNADDAHQRNWLRKHQLAAALGADHSATYGAMGAGSAQRYDAAVVWVDRDRITALAYAYSLDDQRMLAERASWATRHLAAGRLAVAATYLVLHLDPAESIRRRARQLDPAHPWSQPCPLRRLADFYQDPTDALSKTAPEIADVLAEASWVHLDKPTPRRTVSAAADLLRSHWSHAANKQLTSRWPAAATSQ